MLALLVTTFLHAHAAEFKHHGNIYVSGTPTEKQMADFKKQRGATVLDLRATDELGNCSEPAAATKVGLQYNRVNFDKKAKIEPQIIADIDQAVAAAGDKPILLFCKTGNRAAAWLAIHLVRKEGKPLEEAILTAKNLGLKTDMEKAVREYLR